MPQKPSIRKTCSRHECGKEFLIRPADEKRGLGKFCSQSCRSKTLFNLTPGGIGSANPNWKGGITISTRGYAYVKAPGHHRANRLGYVKRAILVLEQKLGRKLIDGEIAHHVNENKLDDSPDNLKEMMIAEHTRHHHFKHDKPITERKPDHPSNRRYNWPSDEQLLILHASFSLRKIADKIGCSWKSVDRKLKRIKAKTSHMMSESPSGMAALS